MILDLNAICQNCHYWHHPTSTCRRHAPVLVPNQSVPDTFSGVAHVTMWPFTAAQDTCGDFVYNIATEVIPKRGMVPSAIPRCVCGDLPDLVTIEQPPCPCSFFIACSCGRRSQNWENPADALLDWKMNCQKP